MLLLLLQLQSEYCSAKGGQDKKRQPRESEFKPKPKPKLAFLVSSLPHPLGTNLTWERKQLDQDACVLRRLLYPYRYPY
jgi:hypothetical protein